MKSFFCILFLIFISLASYSTHSYGGYISYESMGNRTYEFTVHLFLDGSSPAIQRNTIAFNYGDGSSLDTLVRDSLYFYKNNVYVGIYKGIHTYQGLGTFTASLTDPNRSSSITNASNPVSQALYLETTLNTQVDNHSVSLHEAAHFFVKTDTSLEQAINLLAYDEDGDRLIYELVDSKLGPNNPLLNYQIPSTAGINRQDGTLKWSPIGIGDYLFTVKISELRNNVVIGHTTIDFVVESTPSNQTPSLILPGWIPKDSCGVYSLTQSSMDTLIYLFHIIDTNAIMPLSPPVKLFSKLDTNRASVNNIFLGSNRYLIEFDWIIDSTDVRCTPYNIYFRTNLSSETNDLALQLYVLDSANRFCDTICRNQVTSIKKKNQEGHQLKLFPNPSQDFVNIQFENQFDSKSGTIKIYNTHAQEVGEISLNPLRSNYHFDRNGLPSGLYVFRLFIDDEWTSDHKVIFR